jgi:hypothetical protein
MRRFLIALAAVLALASPVRAADSTVAAMTAASALAGSELLYCVQGGADRKCTPSQAATYVFSLVSGDCTAAAGGAITCLKTNGTAFGALATVTPGAGVATLLGGASSGTGGPAGTVSPALTGAPTAPTPAATDNSTTIPTTAYVTTAIANAVAGVNPAVAVQAATTAAANTSGFTYNNGVAGIGATFTGSVNTAVVIDGFTFTALGQRLLVKNDTQSPSGAFNGIYYVTQVQTGILPPILTRALDYDAPSDINNTGAIPVVNGTVNGTTSWLLTSTVNTVGTDPLTFTKFSVNPITTPQTLGQSHIPFVLVSSGSMANNGALTGLTAVATAYPNAYVWMPTGAIAAASAAGWYYATFSSTTAATVFNNTYTSGTPTIPGSPTAFATTGPGAYTQTTGSNIAGYTLAIAGNVIGVNGTVVRKAAWSNNNSAGAKTLTSSFSSYNFFVNNLTTALGGGQEVGFCNRGVANVQAPIPATPLAGAAAAPVFGAIDTTTSQNFVMNMQLATATDTMTLENIVVQLIPGVP